MCLLMSLILFHLLCSGEHIKLHYVIQKGSLVKVIACVLKYSETTWRTKAKFNGAPPWDRGKDGKLIQMFCCYSLFSTPVDGDI